MKHTLPPILSNLLLAPMRILVMSIYLIRKSESYVYTLFVYIKQVLLFNTHPEISWVVVDSRSGEFMLEVISRKGHGYISGNVTGDGILIGSESSRDKFSECYFCGRKDSKYDILIQKQSETNIVHNKALCQSCRSTIEKDSQNDIFKKLDSSELLSNSI